ncbi:MAG: GNAT family N-acetyltransferase [Myxococcales bacterium]|nr:GNAT family N-acetyltransferase [Myxococcales bacterium]
MARGSALAGACVPWHASAVPPEKTPDKNAQRPKARAVKVRRARPEDVEAIYACQAASYASMSASGLCSTRLLRMQVDAFPEGQLVATRGDEVVGYATSLIVQLDEESPWYSYNEITGSGTFSSHNPTGDTLYGADIAVHPDHRGQGVAGKLYEGRMRIVKRFNLRRMVAGGRLPGYAEHAGRMTPEEYVERVTAGELKDSALNAHLKAGYSVLGVHMGYLRDEQSLDYATFLERINERYDHARRRIAAAPMRRPVRRLRVCAAQYEMRRVSDWDAFEQQVDFFVSTAEQYHCHFLLLPELFTAQLFSTLEPGISSVDAIRKLADMTDRYREMFTAMARRSGLHIIGGTHPVLVGDEIRNAAHLFTPTGGLYTQEKLHITPNERKEYGVRPGEGVHVFDTPYARIAIVVCYDIEFPELSRLLTLSGAEVLFVPFSTDERKSYMRVRYSAQARAVENYVYTVLSGNVGNLPQVDNFLINYGQAVVCTPSDFSFPTNAIAGAADLNSETVVICDLDLVALEQARELGSVQPLRHRRTDLYHLEARTPIRVMRTA